MDRIDRRAVEEGVELLLATGHAREAEAVEALMALADDAVKVVAGLEGVLVEADLLLTAWPAKAQGEERQDG